jgi:tetratricopeptide (TPR) repeat protein
MKRLFFSLLFVASLLTGALKAQDAYEVQQKCYRNALKNYDLQAATIALYNMIALKPEKADLNDSLALLYFAGERYPQAYLVGEQILKTNPDRSDILELVAVSKQNLGMIKESLADYEKLYAAEKSLYYLYQMATLQYQLKRYGECVASLDQIINNPESAKQKVNIVIQGGSQDVPMNAAALNVKGICAMELNQEEAAKDNFTKALSVFPDFALAKGNLELLNKKASQDKQTPKAPSTPTKPTTPATTK